MLPATHCPIKSQQERFEREGGIDAVQSLAVDISLAALLGDKVYSFGELLLHPIVSLLPLLPAPITSAP